MMSLMFLVSLCLMAHIRITQSSSEYEYCSSQEDCGPGYCCTLGYTRYTLPVCRALGDLNDLCFPNNELENLNLGFPNGRIYSVETYRRQVCPCQRGLECIHNKCVKYDLNENDLGPS